MLRKTYLLFGACGVGGRFCVLFWDQLVLGMPFDAYRSKLLFLRPQSAVKLGKTPLGKKPLLLGKTHGPLGKPIVGKTLLEKPVAYLKKTYLENPRCYWEKLLGKPVWEKPVLCILRIGHFLGTIGSL